MTFTAMARCPDTGKFGIVTATRPPAVGGRVPHIAPNSGVVAIMAMTDRRLGDTALNLLNIGYKAQGVIDALVSGDPHYEYRQLGVIDADGNAAARTGAENGDWSGHHIRENFIALGNVLVGEHVLDAMEEGYYRSPNATFEERLMQSLEAGRDAGGQHGGQQSAAVLVYAERKYPYLDLRVDLHDEPIGELRRIRETYSIEVDYLWQRQLDPRIKPLHEAVHGLDF
jgi:uncharacterized Ntn-hydrolase superfamily protein